MKELEGKSVGNHLSCFVSLPGFNQPARATREQPQSRDRDCLHSTSTRREERKKKNKITTLFTPPQTGPEVERETRTSSDELLWEWGSVLTENTSQVLIYTKAVRYFEDLSKESHLTIVS